MLLFPPWFPFLRISERPPSYFSPPPPSGDPRLAPDPSYSSSYKSGADEEGSGDRCKSEGLINPANIAVESENRSGKWDNHNTIARGWAGAKANYHPVTFRNIYNVDSQK